MERGSRAITTAHFLSAADSNRGATAYTGTTATWDAAKKKVVQRSAEELFGEGPAAGGGGEETEAMEAISRGALPHQLSGKQQLAVLGIRQPLASPFQGESVLAAASESPQPSSPSGRSQQRRSQAGLSRVSLTHWLQDGEEGRSPRGSLAKQPELVLDPEAADGGSGAAQLDNICDSVSETVDAALEQLRELQRSRSSSNSSSSLSRSYSKGLARLTSLKAAVASAVGGGSSGSSKGAGSDSSAHVHGFDAAEDTPAAADEESGSLAGSPRPGGDSNSSSKGSTLSTLSKVFRRAPSKVASMPALPYEGSSSSRPGTPTATNRVERTVPEAASGWVGQARAATSSSSSQGSFSRQGSSAAPSGFAADSQQQATFATSMATSSSSGRLSRGGSSALPGIATDASAAADGSMSCGIGSPRFLNRQQSSRLGVVGGPCLSTDAGEPPASPKGPTRPAAGAGAAVSGGDGSSTPQRLFRKSMSMSAAVAAVEASPSPPMTPRSRAMGLTVDVNSSNNSAGAAGPPEAPPSGSMSPLARARHALLSRGGERVQTLDGTSTPVPVPPPAADTSSSGGTWAVRSPRSTLGRSGSMKPWDAAADGGTATSSTPSNSNTDNASAYQQSKLAPGRLTHATNSADMSDELAGSRLVQVKGSMKRNVSFAMPGAIGVGEMSVDA